MEDQDELTIDVGDYLELERERRALAEILYEKGVITGEAIRREREAPQVVGPEEPS